MVEVSVRGGRAGFGVWEEEGLGEAVDGFGVPELLEALGCGGVVRAVDDGGWLDVVDVPDEDVAAPLPATWLSGVLQPTSATEHTAAVPTALRSRPLTLI